MNVQGFDPSLTSTGWAIFRNDRLEKCGAIPTSTKTPMTQRIITAAFRMGLYDVDHTVIEVPQVYGRENSKGDPNRLTPLWAIAGALLAMNESPTGRPKCHLWLPHEWKGSVEPQVFFSRILSKLDPAELETFNACVEGNFSVRNPPTKKMRAGDALDAVGICLTAVGRMGKKRL